MKKLLTLFVITSAVLIFSSCGEEAVPLVPVVQIPGKNYAIGKTEVTQAQYEAVMGKNPSRVKGANLPVENVSWNDAVEFCKKLTARERAAGVISANQEYRLPTNEEWEYACRAGTTTAYYTGNTEADLSRAGWYGGNSDGKPHPVGQKLPNAFGLYDMHGSVCEWTSSIMTYELFLKIKEDWIATGLFSREDFPPKNSKELSSYRVIRSGSWRYPALLCRSSILSFFSPEYRNRFFGFRVAVVQTSNP